MLFTLNNWSDVYIVRERFILVQVIGSSVLSKIKNIGIHKICTTDDCTNVYKLLYTHTYMFPEKLLQNICFLFENILLL